MPQLTRCPHCSKPLQVPDEALGKQVRCPGCQRHFLLRAAPARQPAVAGPVPVAKPAGAPPAPYTPRPEARSPAPRSKGAAAECPACKALLLPGTTACPECGFVLQGDAGMTDLEGTPNLCANPACGVANPPGERICQRCSTPLPTPPGTVLHNRYRIEQQLAIGGFGVVYLATDLRQGNRPVALKDMICTDPQEFAIRLSFFQREAEILRSLQGLPIVPRFYDFLQQGPSAYLVLEYIRGQDMLKLLDTNGSRPFPLDAVIEWGKSICDVLTHLHGRSPPVVHRDLKPDNIMLLEDGRSIKLIDFGTARDMGRSQKTQLAAKTRVYTEGYAPPEQIIGKPEPRSDLFALAGTLYHLATGKAPEGFYTARELEVQLAGANGSALAEQRWFFELLKVNLAEDANDRYFTAQEFKADLERRRVTKETACPKCQTVNVVRQPYCLKCAEPLTAAAPPCGHCGKENRLGSRFCVFCGNRLR
jgi:predicted Ser/Thr protein kinase